jgi:hypothetical protein
VDRILWVGLTLAPQFYPLKVLGLVDVLNILVKTPCQDPYDLRFPQGLIDISEFFRNHLQVAMFRITGDDRKRLYRRNIRTKRNPRGGLIVESQNLRSPI